MAHMHYYGRRGVASLLCLFIMVLNGFTVGARSTDDTYVSGVSPATELAFYAGNAEFYRKVKILETLTWPQTQIYDYLESILLEIPRSETSPEIKEADRNECRQLMHDIDHIISVYVNYTELRTMLDEYRAISRGLQRKNVTPERSAELESALMDLEERFRGKEDFASTTLKDDNASYYRESIRKANRLIRNHSSQTPLQSLDQRSLGVSGGKQASLASDSSGDLGGRHSDVTQTIPVSDAGNETMRELLNDRSLLKTLGDVEGMAQKIEAILNGPLMNDINLYAAGSDISPYNAVILDIQHDYDRNYDNFRDIRNAWDVYMRYNDISDKLRMIDPKSSQAVELIEEKQKLELAFEEYGTLVDAESIVLIDWDAWSILWMLGSVEEERKKSKTLHTVSKPLPQTAVLKETITEPGTTELKEPRPSSGTTEPEEPTTKLHPITTNGTTPPEPTNLHLTGGVNVTGRLGRLEGECGIVNNIRGTKDAKETSGLVIIGFTAIQTMVAVGIMASL
ncbi:peptide ABC transporter ATPase, putative [Babesia ovata]|uniref:Peptide ABC transporter ATPase, putative n=1 Tax=Babesia ovata TaxID=189622 RepID=A0A2H6KIB8_9APIC|nr:peptide ABC transporter ATPase, putative [Babesia ovata]GBE62740.1 peptide ABC transporter ATPase, putative [Babesia ovata]